MTRRTLFRLCVALLLPALAIVSAVVPQLSRPGGVAAQTAGTTVTFCGTIGTYTAAGTTTTGTLTFSSPVATFTLAPGANVTLGTGASTAAGSNVCLVGLLGANSQIASATLTVNPATATQVNLCGVVGPFTAATTTATGVITIGGILYPIAVNASAFTGAAVTTGANVCLTATLNALGQITGGVAVANTVTGTTAVNLCGTLSSFTPAASTSTSAIIVFSSPSQSFTVAPGVTVGNTSLATAGSLVCIVGQTNGTQLTSVSFVSTVAPTVTICGVVSAYNPATTSTVGSVTINGTTITLAPNATLSSAITVNANVCLVLTLNALQQATAVAVSTNVVATTTATATATGTPATATATATPATQVICGIITNYLAATATTNGTLTINGTVLGIAPGAVFSGTAIGVNANVCISATLNSAGQIATAAVTSNAVTPTATVNVPPPPPPPGGTATATATAAPAATATATVAPATATPVPAVATPTPKPAKTPKPKATATTVPSGPAPAPAPTAVPAPAKLPATGFGGTGAFAHNAAIGRVFRTTNGNVTTPLGIAAQPASGGSDPISPAVPAILGLAAIGLGVLARKFGFARR